ncbi:MAG TPA: hypothetical protein P5543_10375 [Planctomycetota bacterium]|mgnify:FL=1|nr:hypothetical protein [Planctomycetota bacterium]
MKFFFAILWTCTVLQAELFYLLDNTILQGTILSHDDERVQIQRLDNDGVLTLEWKQLQPSHRKDLQKKVGIILDTPIHITVPGVRVYLRTGGTMQGLLQQKTQTTLTVQTKIETLHIPMSNVLLYEEVPVPLTEVYKDNELYKKILQQITVNTPEKQIELATILIQSELFQQAKTHLEKIKEPHLADQVKSKLLYLEKLENQKKLQSNLYIFQKYKSTHRYEKALEALESLKTKLSDKEYTKLYQETLEKQNSYHANIIPTLWFKKVLLKTRKIVGKRETSIDQARRYVMDDMDSEIYEEIANELGIKSVDIENYIRARTPQRKRKFNYQDGTFIVGLGDFIPPMQNKEKPSSFLDLFKKQTTSSLSEDEWWKISSLHTKREWLQAYYFENKIGNTQNEIKICPVCNGVGKESLKKICNYCQGLCYERIIIFQ